MCVAMSFPHFSWDKSEPNLLFFCGSHVTIRAGCGSSRPWSLSELFVEILLTFFSHAVK